MVRTRRAHYDQLYGAVQVGTLLPKTIGVLWYATYLEPELDKILRRSGWIRCAPWSRSGTRLVTRVRRV